MPRVVPSQVVDLIDKLFPWAKDQAEGDMKNYLAAGNANSIAAILAITQEIPAELITLDPDSYAEFVSSIAALKTQIEQWQSRGDNSYHRIPGLRHLSPVTLIRQALDKCKDQAPAAGTSEFSFIPDGSLRDSFRLDESSAYSSLANGEWKAATVLAGSAIEALLLWVLEQHFSDKLNESVAKLVNKKVFSKPRSDSKLWGLHHYIEVAADLGVVGENTATLVRLAKGYRNLIHPGKTERTKEVCNRSTAMAAIAALGHVTNDLASRYGSKANE